MKKLISNTGGMNTFLEIKPVEAVPGLTHLRITTTYDGSKHPEDTSSPERLPSLLVIQNYSRGGLDGIKLKEIRESFL